MKLASHKRQQNSKPKRVKTFKGCWTCRARKLGCGLERPSCVRCKKSNLNCDGYDVRLFWTDPIKYDSYGNRILGERDIVKLGEDISDSTSGTKENSPRKRKHHRRTINLVRYGTDYSNQDDIEKELSLLENPPRNKIQGANTWIIKRFGVFAVTPKDPYGSHEQTLKSDHPNDLVLNSNRQKSKYMSHESAIDEHSTEIDALGIVQEGMLGNNGSGSLEISYNGIPNFELFSTELKDDIRLSALALQEPTAINQERNKVIDNFDFDNTLFDILNMKSDSTFPYGSNTKEEDRNSSKILEINLQDQKTKETYNEPTSREHSETNLEQNSMTSQNLNGQNLKNDFGHNGGNKVHDNNVGGHDRIPDSTQVKTAMEVISSHLSDKEVYQTLNSFNPLFRIPENGLFVHGLTQFLLNHYMDTVADKMIVVTVSKNPWRTLYFTRVLNALGDLTGLGHTSNSRNSLLNAILALTCFHLLNKFPKASSQQSFFLNLGIDFRRHASHFLKICLQDSVNKEKYKDVLVAIIAMSSIDVVWGTMVECRYYLEICEEFIEARISKCLELSKKAKALHGIFSFLKLIQDSSSLDNIQEKELIFGKNERQEKCPQNLEMENSLNDADHLVLFNSAISKSDGRIITRCVDGPNGVLKSALNNGPQISAPLFTHVESHSYYLSEGKPLEACIIGPDILYGLPNSLIFLFANCVRIVRHAKYYETKDQSYPEGFEATLSIFEKQLLEWKPEWKFCTDAAGQDFINHTVEGVFHHTMSFYYGMVIYFFTMAFNSKLALLQSYVQKVLFHLKSLNTLASEKKVQVLPLMWQGFIAGCASTSSKDQEEFRLWAARFAENGMGSYWGARQVMFEVWKRRELEQLNDNWFAVYQDWKINLMLF